MAEIRRLTDSCVLVADDFGVITMFDPGFHTFESGEIDLDTIGDVHRILITHEHGDHVSPAFVKWVIDRGNDVEVHSNEAVGALLEPHGIEVVTANPDGVLSEDVLHEEVPTGARPPNRSYSVGDLYTQPGDSYQPTFTGRVLALPLMTPWGSATASVEFARRLAPQQVVPVHDFYLTTPGRGWLYGLIGSVLAKDGIEFVSLNWGDAYTP